MRPGCAFVKRIHWIAFALISALLASKPGSGAEKPKLILAVVVDQFRYDYLTRFRADYHDGFDRLLTQGAVFTDAHHIHFPSVSGIIGNEWSRSIADALSAKFGTQNPASAERQALGPAGPAPHRDPRHSAPGGSSGALPECTERFGDHGLLS
jgi:hypothetical protein